MTDTISQRIEKLDHLAGALAQARAVLVSAQELAAGLGKSGLEAEIGVMRARLYAERAIVETELERQANTPRTEPTDVEFPKPRRIEGEAAQLLGAVFRHHQEGSRSAVIRSVLDIAMCLDAGADPKDVTAVLYMAAANLEVPRTSPCKPEEP